MRSILSKCFLISIRFFQSSFIYNLLNKHFNSNFIFRPFNEHHKCDSLSFWSSHQFLSNETKRLHLIDHKSNKLHSNIVSLLLNTIVTNESFKVLDWGGGTGYVWFKIYKSLLNRDLITWSVLDNSELRAIGLNYSIIHDIPIAFLSYEQLMPYDLLYINSALQYASSYQDTLSQLLLFKPKYLIFESLLSRPSHGFTLIQSLYQSSSPCTFLSEKEFVNYITSQGYTLAYRKDNFCY